MKFLTRQAMAGLFRASIIKRQEESPMNGRATEEGTCNARGPLVPDLAPPALVGAPERFPEVRPPAPRLPFYYQPFLASGADFLSD